MYIVNLKLLLRKHRENEHKGFTLRPNKKIMKRETMQSF